MSTGWRAAIRLLPALAFAVLGACGGGGGRTPPPDVLRPGAPGLTLLQEWSWPSPLPSSAGMPAADAEGVAITSGRQRVALVDGEGSLRWEAQRVGVRDVAPLLTPDLVVVPVDHGAVGYERATGRKLWEAALGERVNTPVVAGGRLVASTWEGSLVALDPADGRVVWRIELGGDSLGPAAGAGSVVVATFDSGRAAGAVAVDAASGQRRWTVPLPADGVSAPAVVSPAAGGGGTAVVVAGDSAAHGLSLDDGATQWRRELEGAGSPEVPPLPLEDGTVLVPHRQGGFALLDPRDGGTRWQASSDGAAVRGGPAGPGPEGWFALPLDDGRLLLARADGATDLRRPPDGLVVGVASGPDRRLLIATSQGEGSGLTAVRGW